MDGFINIDSFSECNPDLLMDLEKTPWDFPDNSVEEITANHVLEHLGREIDVFFNIIKEIYRIMKNGAVFNIAVPHHMHYTFHTDPTHVRAFTRGTFEMLDRKKNLDWIAKNTNTTMLAVMLGVDFEIIEGTQVYDPKWHNKLLNHEITLEELRILAEEKIGVVKEIRVSLRANKN